MHFIHLSTKKSAVAEQWNHQQCLMCLLKNELVVFLQGMISLVLECIDRLHVYSSAAHFAEVVGREAAEAWSSILNSLYQLLGTRFIHVFRCGQVSAAPGDLPSNPSSCVILKLHSSEETGKTVLSFLALWTG